MQTRIYRGIQQWSDASTARAMHAQELQLLRLQRHLPAHATAQEPVVGPQVWTLCLMFRPGFAFPSCMDVQMLQRSTVTRSTLGWQPGTLSQQVAGSMYCT
jgi:hypothetical protein